MTTETLPTKPAVPRSPGRPRIANDKTVRTTITILPEHLEAMKELGNGNLSIGIRYAIESIIAGIPGK